MKASLLTISLLSLLTTQIPALKIATSLQWIEHTPQPYAISNFYKGTTTATLSSGGVANLPTDKTIDLAANAETQGLKQYANHKNLRLIYVIVEVPYRLVANKASGITKLADLKGKKIGTFPGTSAAVFVNFLLGSVGLKSSDYSVVSGNVCMKAPCASGTLPQMITGKQVDAFGIWEPAVELGIQALDPSNSVVFQNASLYREVYSLYSTTEKLADATTRKNIVAFLKALDQTLEVYRSPTQSLYQYVADKVGMDAGVVKDVWDDHRWTGGLPEDLLEFLVTEDAYLAKTDGRAGVSRADLASFIDSSVLAEAKKS